MRSSLSFFDISAQTKNPSLMSSTLKDSTFKRLNENLVQPFILVYENPRIVRGFKKGYAYKS